VVEPGQSFDEFVIAHGPGLLRFGYLLTSGSDLAQDLVQDALVKMYSRWSSVGRIERPDAYLRRVMVNDLTNRRRKLSNRETPSDPPDSAVADGTDAVSQRDEIWRILAQLPSRQRVVLVLRYYEEYSDEEIAAALGCAVSTVRSLASRAFTRLRGHPALAHVLDEALAHPEEMP
jgi:RNA polymerase sigma-70 factor (sigma-E family)